MATIYTDKSITTVKKIRVDGYMVVYINDVVSIKSKLVL